MKRLRVLAIAEACNPEWVSVPLVGWSHCLALREVVDLHVVTQIRNRDAMVRAGWVEGRDFTAIDSEFLDRKLWKIGEFLRGGKGKGWTTKMALGAISYPVFEHLIWKQFKARIRGGEFDVVHRITPLSPTLPSWMAGKCKSAGVPFVLGPLNGGVAWPKGFDGARREEREWLSYVRGAYALLPGFRATRRNASAILIASRDTWNQMPGKYLTKCEYVAENAVDLARFGVLRNRTAARPIRAVFVGRLVPYKGADMVLEAAAELVRKGELVVEIIGDGPQKQQLVELIEREKLGSGVCLAGWVEHGRVQERLANADVLAFPSIREFGGGVVLEAMAIGVVPVVMDYGGPGELVTEKTGWALAMGTRAEIVRRLRETLEKLAQHPELIDAKSPAAARRAREQFSWGAKARQVLEVYRWVMGEREKPNFAMPTPDLEGEERVGTADERG